MIRIAFLICTLLVCCVALSASAQTNDVKFAANSPAKKAGMKVTVEGLYSVAANWTCNQVTAVATQTKKVGGVTVINTAEAVYNPAVSPWGPDDLTLPSTDATTVKAIGDFTAAGGSTQTQVTPITTFPQLLP